MSSTQSPATNQKRSSNKRALNKKDVFLYYSNLLADRDLLKQILVDREKENVAGWLSDLHVTHVPDLGLFAGAAFDIFSELHERETREVVPRSKTESFDFGAEINLFSMACAPLDFNEEFRPADFISMENGWLKLSIPQDRCPLGLCIAKISTEDNRTKELVPSLSLNRNGTHWTWEDKLEELLGFNITGNLTFNVVVATDENLDLFQENKLVLDALLNQFSGTQQSEIADVLGVDLAAEFFAEHFEDLYANHWTRDFVRFEAAMQEYRIFAERHNLGQQPRRKRFLAAWDDLQGKTEEGDFNYPNMIWIWESLHADEPFKNHLGYLYSERLNRNIDEFVYIKYNVLLRIFLMTLRNGEKWLTRARENGSEHIGFFRNDQNLCTEIVRTLEQDGDFLGGGGPGGRGGRPGGGPGGAYEQ